MLSALGICLTACASTDPPTESSSPTCGPGTPIFACPSTIYHTGSAAAPTSSNDPVSNSANGLVPARHPDCNIGGQLLRYLATGDNAGHPWLDQNYANDVGATPPQARAIADEAIEACDAALDQRAAAATAAASASAAATSRQQAAAEQLTARESNCAAIGGKYDAQWQWCASTVSGNPSGEAGADCRNASVPFDGVTIDPKAVRHELEWYPGCFPS